MKKIFLFFFLFLVLAVLSPKKVSAAACQQGDRFYQTFDCWLDAMKDDDNNAQQTLYTIDALWKAPIALFCDPKAAAVGACIQGADALNMVNSKIIAMYANPAADPAAFIADIGSRMGLVKPAYAQQVGGIGFRGLSPLLNVWTAFRNIAYALLIIVMVIIGFMIMFRRKIDPRTVVTVQNALPRIILTLILITFSYAIAGLLIDLMYVVIGLSYVALGAVDSAGALRHAANDSFPDLFGSMIGLGIGSFDDVYNILIGTAKAIGSNILDLEPLAVGGGIVGTIVSVVAAGASFPVFALTAGIITALPALIVLLAILFATLRIFFMLLSAYMQTLISVIFAPLYIMAGAFPGNSAFSNWLRGLVANISVFAVTAILLALGIIISDNVLNPGENNAELWAPPGIAGHVGRGMAGLIGLGMTLVIPSIAAAVKEALKAKPIAPVGPSIFLGPLGSTLGAAQQGLSTMMYFKGAFGKK